MTPNQPRPNDSSPDDLRLEDLPARPTVKTESPARRSAGASMPTTTGGNADDEVIRIEDLTPRENVSGGRKVILGEIATRPEEPM